MLHTLSIFLLIVSFNIFSQERVGPYPPSSRYAPFIKDINQEKFNQIIKEFEEIYVENDGFTQIKFDTKWKNSFTVAYASHRKTDWIVYVNGGMARATYMSVDAFRFLLCHEIGHHIGGVPFATGNRWAAAEGQADYFATSKCMKRVLKEMDNETFLKGVEVPKIISSSCEQAYLNSAEQNICKRSALGAMQAVNAFSYMLSTDLPSLETPDRSIIYQTILDDYPSIQCRLDTVLAGAVCDIDSIGMTNSNSAHYNGCTSRNGDQRGLRPTCWFNEDEFF